MQLRAGIPKNKIGPHSRRKGRSSGRKFVFYFVLVTPRLRSGSDVNLAILIVADLRRIVHDVGTEESP